MFPVCVYPHACCTVGMDVGTRLSESASTKESRDLGSLLCTSDGVVCLGFWPGPGHTRECGGHYGSTCFYFFLEEYNLKRFQSHFERMLVV